MEELTDHKRERIFEGISKIAIKEGIDSFIIYYETIDACTYASSTTHTATKPGMVHMLKRIVEKSDDEANAKRER